MAENVRTTEARMRHTLKRRGYYLKKSRRKDPLAIGYGTYWIYEADSDSVVFPGPGNIGATLEEIVDWVDNMGTRKEAETQE